MRLCHSVCSFRTFLMDFLNNNPKRRQQQHSIKSSVSQQPLSTRPSCRSAAEPPRSPPGFTALRSQPLSEPPACDPNGLPPVRRETRAEGGRCGRGAIIHVCRDAMATGSPRSDWSQIAAPLSTVAFTLGNERPKWPVRRQAPPSNRCLLLTPEREAPARPGAPRHLPLPLFTRVRAFRAHSERPVGQSV